MLHTAVSGWLKSPRWADAGTWVRQGRTSSFDGPASKASPADLSRWLAGLSWCGLCCTDPPCLPLPPQDVQNLLHILHSTSLAQELRRSAAEQLAGLAGDQRFVGALAQPVTMDKVRGAGLLGCGGLLGTCVTP